MTRLLTIIVALLAVSSAFAAARVYAAPGATALVVPAGDQVCLEPAEAIATSGKYCVKRHLMGVPCTPAPGIMPCPPVLPPMEREVGLQLPAGAQLADATWPRFYRPPRPVLV